MRSVLVQLLNPSREAREVMAALGVELQNADGSARPLKDVLDELRVALAMVTCRL